MNVQYNARILFFVEAPLDLLLWDAAFVCYFNILRCEELPLCMLSKLYSISALLKTSENSFSPI